MPHGGVSSGGQWRKAKGWKKGEAKGKEKVKMVGGGAREAMNTTVIRDERDKREKGEW